MLKSNNHTICPSCPSTRCPMHHQVAQLQLPLHALARPLQALVLLLQAELLQAWQEQELQPWQQLVFSVCLFCLFLCLIVWFVCLFVRTLGAMTSLGAALNAGLAAGLPRGAEGFDGAAGAGAAARSCCSRISCTCCNSISWNSTAIGAVNPFGTESAGGASGSHHGAGRATGAAGATGAAAATGAAGATGAARRPVCPACATAFHSWNELFVFPAETACCHCDSSAQRCASEGPPRTSRPEPTIAWATTFSQLCVLSQKLLHDCTMAGITTHVL